MTRPKDVPYLQLVTEEPLAGVNAGVERRSGQPRGIQLSLFREPSPAFLGFLGTGYIRSDRFIEIMREVRPTWLLDLRPAALFDFDSRLGRRLAFTLFREFRITYRDIADTMELTSRKDARLNSGEVSRVVNDLLVSSEPGPRGPIIVLLDDDDMLDTAVKVMPKTLAPAPRGGWQAHVFTGHKRPSYYAGSSFL